MPSLGLDRCARLLWALTASWRPADGDARKLADAREALARLAFALDGERFAEPQAPARRRGRAAARARARCA